MVADSYVKEFSRSYTKWEMVARAAARIGQARMVIQRVLITHPAQ